MSTWWTSPRARSTGAPSTRCSSAATAFIVFLMVGIWAATGFGDLLAGLGLVRSFDPAHGAVRDPAGAATGHGDGGRCRSTPRCRASNGVILTFIWFLTGFGFWLFWPLFGMGALLILHAFLTAWWRALHPKREKELTDRVDVLTRTRRGALDAQAAELRRIERDLHDGAQARLVALSMQLGRAEDRLDEHPEAAELVRNARVEASNAIKELRDLARGIAPPVLADRGLPAAVESLGERSALPVKVDARLGAPPLAGRRVRRLLRRRRVADQRGQVRPRRVGARLAVRGERPPGGRGRRRGPGRREPRRQRALRPQEPCRSAGWHPGGREQPRAKARPCTPSCRANSHRGGPSAPAGGHRRPPARERVRRGRAGRGRPWAAAHIERTQAGPRDRRRPAPADIHR